MNPRWLTLREHPSVRRFFRAVLLVAHGFRGEAISLRTAALTYLTLLSLVPLLAVVYSAVDLFTGEAQNITGPSVRNDQYLSSRDTGLRGRFTP